MQKLMSNRKWSRDTLYFSDTADIKAHITRWETTCKANETNYQFSSVKYIAQLLNNFTENF